MKNRKQKLLDKRHRRSLSKKNKKRAENKKRNYEKKRMKNKNPLKQTSISKRLINRESIKDMEDCATCHPRKAACPKAIETTFSICYNKLSKYRIGRVLMKRNSRLPNMLIFTLIMLGLLILSLFIFNKLGNKKAEPTKAAISYGKVSMLSSDKATDSSQVTVTTSPRMMPDSSLIDNFSIIYQEPELPTGCEITAMTMLMNYYGCSVDKTTMASEYLPTADYNCYEKDGVTVGTDFEKYFMGDPFSVSGCVCGTPAVEKAANDYFKENSKGLKAVDISGSTPDELYKHIANGTPVFVLCTIGMYDRYETQGWLTEDGRYIEWSTNDHGAVLIGYSKTTVTIADPISGLYETDRKQFEKVFKERNNGCVMIESENAV